MGNRQSWAEISHTSHSLLSDYLSWVFEYHAEKIDFKVDGDMIVGQSMAEIWQLRPTHVTYLGPYSSVQSIWTPSTKMFNIRLSETSSGNSRSDQLSASIIVWKLLPWKYSYFVLVLSRFRLLRPDTRFSHNYNTFLPSVQIQ